MDRNGIAGEPPSHLITRWVSLSQDDVVEIQAAENKISLIYPPDRNDYVVLQPGLRK